MIEILLLRLDAPLMSFGAPIVDNLGFCQEFPSLSLVTGLLGNALGYTHQQFDLLSRLQTRIRYAVRRDRLGRQIMDYQTVDLGQDHLNGTGWTTRGVVEERGKGEATSGTHIRYRHYRADSVYSLAVSLEPADEEPSVDTLERALMRPARPLFIGRKPCLPSSPLFLGRRTGESLYEALKEMPRLAQERADPQMGPIPAWWPVSEAGEGESMEIVVTDERDWRNQIHVGRRRMRRGSVCPAEVAHE